MSQFRLQLLWIGLGAGARSTLPILRAASIRLPRSPEPNSPQSTIRP
jgi:hypothetical protein